MQYIKTTILFISCIVLAIMLKTGQTRVLPEIPEYELCEEPSPSRVETLAKAIEDFEGYYLGSVAYRNNNPGNLRYSPLQAGKRGGFAYFDSYEEGFEALKHQIRIAASGDSRVYRPDMTLLEFFNTYAPASDSNQPNVYYKFVMDKTGFAEGMQIKDLL